uniref:Carboxylesterase n=1 Tax=Pieris rapae TaxID=64459 RepID=A0A1U9X1U6_PIERA|nr:carboxylesterase [Pieris rapae]
MDFKSDTGILNYQNKLNEDQIIQEGGMESKHEKCIVQTQNGWICGYIDKRDEGTYYKFKSIPYAEPPVGNLRFMPPKCVKPWKNILDCTKNAPVPLSLFVNHDVFGSEDCLYIEVSSPNIKPDKPLPVMFWIGSCNFTFYIDSILDPTHLNNQGVVFVRCGFRLGPFGFLSINDFSAPGNVGLKDLILAFKWVQANISNFGGDPNNVTAFGSGTGGAIVHLMILSPLASGLFHKAIVQSSSALNDWSLAKNPVENTMTLAKHLGIKTTDKFEVVEEMRKLSGYDIMKTYSTYFYDKYRADNDVFDSPFKPSIENEFEGQPTFISKSPAKILNSGKFNKVPMMIGTNNVEAKVLQYIKDNFYKDYNKYNEDVKHLVPKSLANVNSDSLRKIGQQILSFYFVGVEKVNQQTQKQYLQFLSDYYFHYHLDKTIRIHSKVSPECPIYYYVLNYAGEWLVPKELEFFNTIGHSAELPFLFGIKLSDGSFCKGSCISLTTRDRCVKMWTNFAKYGNPTPTDNDELLQITWDSVENEKRLNFLSINSDLTKGRNPFYNRMLFWENIHKEHIVLKVITHMNDMGLKF